MEEEKRLTLILPNLPAAKEKRVLQALPAALGAGWTERALRLMEARHGRMVAQIPRILHETGQHAELRFNPEWYQLAGQIISGTQPKLEEIMIGQMSEFTGKEIVLDNLTVSEIVGWLIDCESEIQQFLI
jgi:hypothetical protein